MIDGREIALGVLSVIDTSPPDIVDAAAAAGFDSVTLRLLDASQTDPNPLASDTAVRRETIARLRHHGLGVLDVEVLRLRAGHDSKRAPTRTRERGRARRASPARGQHGRGRGAHRRELRRDLRGGRRIRAATGTRVHGRPLERPTW